MIFRRAIRRLTAAYTVVQLVLFGAFALAVYFYVTGTFDFDTAEVQGEGGLASAEQGFTTLRDALVVIYGALLFVVPVSSWLMARAAMAPVRRSYELQQRFVDGASHEMRTPLAVIQGELELALTRSRTPVEYERAIRVAADATAGLVRLTNDLLLLSRGIRANLPLGLLTLSLTVWLRMRWSKHPPGSRRSPRSLPTHRRMN